jgi:CRP-like cAMP-binding protein
MEVFLAHIGQTIDLTEEEKTLLASRLSERKYLKGQYIGQEGDITKQLTFITNGTVRTFYLDENGNEHIISFGIEQWWAGDLGSMITQKPADFNVQCLENTDVVQISVAALEELYQAIPKLERFFRILIERAYASTQRRIVRNYSLSARERYLLFLEEYPEIAKRVPQYMIASYLGITKEFLSNIRSQIAKSP